MMDINNATTPVWLTSSPAEAGFDPHHLEEAVTFAISSETRWPRDMYIDGIFVGSAHVDDKPPYNRPMGPVFARGGANGLVLRHGKLVAEWGDTHRTDMTFSIAKSYLAILTGLAFDKGLIGSIDEPVRERVKDGGFDDPHNGVITWRHLLEQTSEWHGELFERPDSVDWHRQVGPSVTSGAGNSKGTERSLASPGTHFEYNDVRVNRLGLSLLRLFKRPLPEVLKEHIMDPIGCSATWAWHGYETSWVNVDGHRMQSVPGGGHWGGGIVINSRDHARLGELIKNKGQWDGRQLLSREWVETMLVPSRLNPTYGLLWWLNTDRLLYSQAPETSVFALGGGSNIIWIDEPRDLVIVIRWLDKTCSDDLLGKFTRAIIA
ncbi:serine hydrolase domain-containing protein [Microvirga puerhi]|uniref:Serine hydrolase n=1 Tax=Microvirga puerhi TaxID=2876078 RepID=A0ABS7VTT0_9HYPH|nr:serine hydrolase [Microvirga puerhi]MBZ6078981.1 serine hydrolase [Microvirga puerhi]